MGSLMIWNGLKFSLTGYISTHAGSYKNPELQDRTENHRIKTYKNRELQFK